MKLSNSVKFVLIITKNSANRISSAFTTKWCSRKQPPTCFLARQSQASSHTWSLRMSTRCTWRATCRERSSTKCPPNCQKSRETRERPISRAPWRTYSVKPLKWAFRPLLAASRPSTRATKAKQSNSSRNQWFLTRRSRCRVTSSCPRAKAIFLTHGSKRRRTPKWATPNLTTWWSLMKESDSICTKQMNRCCKTLSCHKESLELPGAALHSTWHKTISNILRCYLKGTLITKPIWARRSQKQKLNVWIIITKLGRSNSRFRRNVAWRKFLLIKRKHNERKSTVIS